jgi:hypothetical protein
MRLNTTSVALNDLRTDNQGSVIPSREAEYHAKNDDDEQETLPLICPS